MPVPAQVITPPSIEWEFESKRGPSAGTKRTFYQSELSIDGEVALLGLAMRSISTLAEQGFPISQIAELQLPDGTLDVAKAGNLAAQASPILPGLAAESTAIMFGYYPQDEMGRRDPDYDGVVSFIRSSISVSRWVDVLKVFSEQNDWQRMAAPFGDAIRKGVELGLWTERTRAAALEAEKTSTNSTSPESSTNSSPRATARRKSSGGE